MLVDDKQFDQRDTSVTREQHAPSQRSLATLPSEILLQIVSHAPNARFLRNVALTCRALYFVVERDGWRLLALSRFPSVGVVTPPWKDAARTLTTLSRNFDRRAFMASLTAPTTLIHCLPSGETRTTWKRQFSQTMEYQPIIDSYELMVDGWRSRSEVVAWGAGAELVLNVVERDGNLRQYRNAAPTNRQAATFEVDSGCSNYQWFVYKDPEHIEGRDDITSVNLLPPGRFSSAAGDDAHKLVVGRASGDLTLLSLSPGRADCVKKTFRTQESAVKSADVSSSSGSELLAVTLADGRAALYSLLEEGPMVIPNSQIACVSEDERSCKVWGVKFLSHDQVAVSRGPSSSLVHVHDIRPEGLVAEASRRFGTGEGLSMRTSAYPVIRVPDSSSDRESSGNLLLSGGYDGSIRMHDMRSPMDCVQKWRDPTDLNAIFSLTMVGRERIIAGASHYAQLKFFDARMPGGRVYAYDSALSTSARQRNPMLPDQNWEGSNSFARSKGWNMWSKVGSSRNSTPVYSLSRPSPFATSLYAGMEGRVLHINMTSATDRTPDPKFESALYRDKFGGFDVRKSWANAGLDMSMNEHVTDGMLHMLRQRSVSSLSNHGIVGMPAYDVRWHTNPSRKGVKYRRR